MTVDVFDGAGRYIGNEDGRRSIHSKAALLRRLARISRETAEALPMRFKDMRRDLMTDTEDAERWADALTA